MPDTTTFPLPTLGGKQLWADEQVHRGYRIQRNVLIGSHRLLDPRNRLLAWGDFAECARVFDAQPLPERSSGHVVLLLHGLFRAKEAFDPMARALEKAGFEAETVNYPSTQTALEMNADQIERLIGRLRQAETLSFVGHSLGGLVSREVLTRKGAWRERFKVNRLVTIATPHRGSVMANTLLPYWTWRQLAGPASRQLTTDYVPSLPIPDLPFGVIAGVRGDGKGYNPLLPGDDDAYVSEESARLEGAEDTLTVKAIHTFIMQSPEVIDCTIRYLRTGRFREE